MGGSPERRAGFCWNAAALTMKTLWIPHSSDFETLSSRLNVCKATQGLVTGSTLTLRNTCSREPGHQLLVIPPETSREIEERDGGETERGFTVGGILSLPDVTRQPRR